MLTRRKIKERPLVEFCSNYAFDAGFHPQLDIGTKDLTFTALVFMVLLHFVWVE